MFNLRPAPEFVEWLRDTGIYRDGQPAQLDGSARRQLLRAFESSLEGIA
jgi:ethanolamine ammonia-lyase large subunit